MKAPLPEIHPHAWTELTCGASTAHGDVDKPRRISERSDRALELILPLCPSRTVASSRAIERRHCLGRTKVPAHLSKHNSVAKSYHFCCRQLSFLGQSTHGVGNGRLRTLICEGDYALQVQAVVVLTVRQRQYDRIEVNRLCVAAETRL